MESFANIHVVDHPFVIDSLTHLRNKESDIQKFRRHSDQICQLLFAEAIRGLAFKSVEIETPLAQMSTKKLDEEVIVVPVLRAGLAMMFGAMKFLPKSKFGFVGLERDEQTSEAKEYYWKLPEINQESVIIVTDPMLATGGSTLHVLRRLYPLHPKKIRVVCVICAPEGLKAVHAEFPQTEIFTAAIDQKLDEHNFIYPGLGDYGDRYFGTE